MSAPYIFSTDVQINKGYPGFEYNPTETGGSWYEDREIQGTIVRAVNATFNDTLATWSQLDPSQPSDAVINYPDGTVGYLHPYL